MTGRKGSDLGSSPLVSVVMPTFNSARYVTQAVRSVIDQSFQDWELLVVDDASQDETVQISRGIAEKDSRITVYSRSDNQGAAATRNEGIAASRGRYIAFLDSDDIWLPGKLSSQLAFMQTQQCAFSFSAYALIDQFGRETGKTVDLRSPDVVTYRDMLAKRATLGCSTVVIDVHATGKFRMPAIRTGQDYALWLELLRPGRMAHRLGKVLTHYRITPNSISRNKILKARRQWQIYRTLEGLEFTPALWYFGNYAWRAVFRR